MNKGVETQGVSSSAGIDKALEIAVSVHAGQTDKVGQPYILHPLRIMLRHEREEERIVAILHDVVEDSGGRCTLNDLRLAGFADAIVDAVDALTRRDDEAYEAYVERASRLPLARRIKIADLEDNMDFRRRHHLLDREKDRMARYQQAYQVLTGRDFDVRGPKSSTGLPADPSV